MFFGPARCPGRPANHGLFEFSFAGKALPDEYFASRELVTGDFDNAAINEDFDFLDAYG